jgi:hypothetical protein
MIFRDRVAQQLSGLIALMNKGTSPTPRTHPSPLMAEANEEIAAAAASCGWLRVV